MSDEKGIEIQQKILEYSERHRFWSGKAVEQLSNMGNYLYTITAAMLGYCLSNRPAISSCECMFLALRHNWSIVIYLISILCFFMAIFYGTVANISRLSDFRITRNITLTRKRFLKKSMTEKDNDILKNGMLLEGDFNPPNMCERVDSIMAILRQRIYWISSQEVKTGTKQSISDRVTSLSKHSRNFGYISHLYTVRQSISMLLGAMSYVLYFISNQQS